ncbi:hypothetical protein [Verrucosispora sp. WMMD573]|uniref:VOC family protein n=1 Tax=Verrucosispora sp. WMMD573 TaxID=3015149 RepID=UPI00248CBF91|nr:hypothetical protein [Verrucosispora sp. WMMD573]WBB53568.1 hypothetical protein O7601_23845 [Verrucosispora sp. WMMD573]
MTVRAQPRPRAHVASSTEGTFGGYSCDGLVAEQYELLTAEPCIAGKSPANLATWYVDDIDQIVDELVSSGVEMIRYDQLDHDARGITARAGGGRIAWFQDPDGNTFALEADT